jgi:signal transduction histidine kinase
MEKLSAMGQLVSEVAHQFNNPLVGVINLAQLAEREADNPQQVRELLGEIRKAGEHCRGFVERMLRFTQLANLQRQPTDIGGLMRDTVAFFAQSVADAPAVEFEEPAQAVELRVDPVLMRHALFNLLHNAAQADPRGPITMHLSAQAHQGLAGWTLAVTDHGPGIAPEAMAKLFTPFFTTREGGTGLGLSVAHHVAVQHGGRLWAENLPAGGARFAIWLPQETGEGTDEEDTAG